MLQWKKNCVLTDIHFIVHTVAKKVKLKLTDQKTKLTIT